MFRAKNGEILQKRKVTKEDVPEMERLAKVEFYNVGAHNMLLYLECSPDTWYLITNGANEIVAYDTNNHLKEINLCFGFGLVVREDYRGQGLTRYFDTMQYSKIPNMGNSSNDSLKRYKSDTCGEKLLGYYGTVGLAGLEKIRPAKPPSDFQLCKVTENEINDVVTYDASKLLFERRTFLTEWILGKKYPCDTVTFAGYQSGRVCGYGVLRECDKYYMVSPLYADDDHTAEWLLYLLLEKLPTDGKLYIYFPAKNRLMLRLAIRLNLVFVCTELRESFGFKQANMWSVKNVYAMHEYYPI